MTENESAGGVERRSFLKSAALVSGAMVWATPTVQSLVSPAFATGTGLCPPGRLLRFKYDVDENNWDSGDAGGGGASWCLPDGYEDADLAVDANGCYTIDGTTQCLTITISDDGKTAYITIPPGTRIEDLSAKAGAEANGECEDAEVVNGNTVEIRLATKKISFVAGVLCV